MTAAVILAGGSGKRMNMEIPKQFLTVDNKPVLIYTLEDFEKNPNVDAIVVVCIDGWHDILRAYAKQYNITKLQEIVHGGSTSQESIRNGVYALKEICSGEEDVVIIHDGIRPLVDQDVLTDVIVKARIYGNAVTSMPYNEQIFVKKDEQTTTQYIPRDTLRRVSTPQAYHYKTLCACYERAFAEGIGISPSSYTNTMMVDLGYTLYFASGSDKNIKLTTRDDLDLFQALMKAKAERR